MADHDTTRPDPRPEALTLPIDRIRWAANTAPRDDLRLFDELRPRSWIERTWERLHPDRRTFLAVLAPFAVCAAITVAAGVASADPRLAPPGCTTVEVEPGNTMSGIGQRAGLTLEQVVALNGHIDNPNLIHPGDQIAVACPAGAPPVERLEHVDVEKYRNIYESPGVLSWPSIIAELYNAGARGTMLVELAATTQCESNRLPAAVGDTHLVGKGWGPSIGILQVRTRDEQRGTGGARDEDALRSSIEHQAWGAVQVAEAQGMRAWTCYQLGHHKGFIGLVTQTARDMGVLS